MKPFTDLHTHTTYSQLDGMIKIEDYIAFAKEIGLSAISMTDHGNIDGIMNFYIECEKAEIKPIIGCEVYCSTGLHEKGDEETRNNHHLILIAKNNVGFQNLLQLITFANTENFYRKPRITFDKLQEFSEGLICSTACVGSQFAHLIKNERIEECEALLRQYKSLFKGDFYIEYGYHEFEDEKLYVNALIGLAKKLNIKTIIANDSHYLRKEDEVAHKILMCKGEKQTINDESRFDYTHNYYKSREEIIEIFKEFPKINVGECIDNIYEIVDKIEPYNIKFDDYVYSEFPVPEGFTQKSYLLQLVKENIPRRYPDEKLTDEIKERIKYELSVILKMNFAGYFLMVADYVNWAKNNKIRVGTARGSAGGSVICYILGITEVDPIKYNLIFERFLNPDRVSFPDIDTDFETSKRHLVIEYLTGKYGKFGAVQISTKGYLKGKSAIKTASSRMEQPFDKWNKVICHIKDPKIDTVEKVIEASEPLRTLMDSEEKAREVIQNAKTIEGNIQSTGTHASAIVLSHNPITNICPIVRTKDGLATAWSDKIVEKIGLIKFDILGLSNLSVIENTLQKIPFDIDVYNLPLDDEPTYKLLQNAETNGVFQLESQGMRSLLKRLKPEEIKHIDAVVALYRPGAMQFMEDYVENKKDPSRVTYIDERLEPVLKDTYGQMVYQEQVMKIAQVLAGYTMAEADSLRRAIGKKKMEEMKKHRDGFVSGCVKNGVKKDVAETLYEQIEKFAEYSFNRAHSIAYAIIAYQTAYLKANYYHEFMCSLLNNSIGNDAKIDRYFSECFEKGVKIVPPKVNKSTKEFEVDEEKNILFPLTAIKGLGEKLVQRIIKEQNKKPFKSFIDFCQRVKPDKKTIVALLESNCFSEIESCPKKWLYLADYVCNAISDLKKNYRIDIVEHVKNQIHKEIIKKDDEIISLIKQRRAIEGGSKQAKADKAEINLKIDERANVLLPQVDIEMMKNNYGFTKMEISENESKYLAFQVTTNVNSIFQKYKKCFTFTDIEEMEELEVGSDISTVGEIKELRVITTRGGKRMAFATLSYCGNTIGLTFFSSQWEDMSKIKNGDYVRLTGKFTENRDESFGKYNIHVNKINVLSCLNGEEVYIQDISEWTDTQKDYYRQGLTSLSKSCYNNNEEIHKILMVKRSKEENPIIMGAKYWISNVERYRQLLLRYKLQ